MDREQGRRRWAAWKEQTFGSDKMIWHDGLNTEAVAHLTGEARCEVVEMLLLGLRLGDDAAPRALSAMDERGAAGTLEAALENSWGRAKTEIAVALQKFQPEKDYSEHVIAAVRPSEQPWSTTIDHVIALRHFNTPEVIRVLLDTVVEANDYLVRYHAFGSLLALRGLDPQEEVAREIFPHLCGPEHGPPSREDRQRYQKARAMLASLMEGGDGSEGAACVKPR